MKGTIIEKSGESTPRTLPLAFFSGKRQKQQQTTYSLFDRRCARVLPLGPTAGGQAFDDLPAEGVQEPGAGKERGGLLQAPRFQRAWARAQDQNPGRWSGLVCTGTIPLPENLPRISGVSILGTGVLGLDCFGTKMSMTHMGSALRAPTPRNGWNFFLGPTSKWPASKSASLQASRTGGEQQTKDFVGLCMATGGHLSLEFSLTFHQNSRMGLREPPPASLSPSPPTPKRQDRDPRAVRTPTPRGVFLSRPAPWKLHIFPADSLLLSNGSLDLNLLVEIKLGFPLYPRKVKHFAGGSLHQAADSLQVHHRKVKWKPRAGCASGFPPTQVFFANGPLFFPGVLTSECRVRTPSRRGPTHPVQAKRESPPAQSEFPKDIGITFGGDGAASREPGGIIKSKDPNPPPTNPPPPQIASSHPSSPLLQSKLFFGFFNQQTEPRAQRRFASFPISRRQLFNFHSPYAHWPMCQWAQVRPQGLHPPAAGSCYRRGACGAGGAALWHAAALPQSERLMGDTLTS